MIVRLVPPDWLSTNNVVIVDPRKLELQNSKRDVRWDVAFLLQRHESNGEVFLGSEWDGNNNATRLIFEKDEDALYFSLKWS